MQQTLPGTSNVSHSNLGKEWESMLDRANHYYLIRKMSDVAKQPVIWTYASDKQFEGIVRAGVKSGYATVGDGKHLIRKKSDVDYTGGARGRSVKFDAKQTKRKSLPFANIEKHQIQTLVDAENCGSIAGLMVYFSEDNRAFFLRATVVDRLYTAMLYKKGAKSIPLAVFESEGIEIPLRNHLADWLDAIVK